jgi:hypothetical protein
LNFLQLVCGAVAEELRPKVLGIEIDRHISSDFLTLYIQQQVRRGKIEQRLKTANAVRQVDLHPAIATRLKQFVGGRKVGLLFCTAPMPLYQFVDPPSRTNLLHSCCTIGCN